MSETHEFGNKYVKATFRMNFQDEFRALTLITRTLGLRLSIALEVMKLFLEGKREILPPSQENTKH